MTFRRLLAPADQPGRLVRHRGATSWHENCLTLLARLEFLRARIIGPIDMVRGDDCSKVLSPREREVARLVAGGLSNKEVARELGLSEGTVKIHLHHILQKLGAKTRYGLIVHLLHAAE
jgi:DNA-binding NarL/FixJ family response regulator